MPMPNRDVLDPAHHPLIGAMVVIDYPRDVFDNITISVLLDDNLDSAPHLPTREVEASLSAPLELKVRLPHVVRHIARNLQDLVGPADARSAASQLLAIVALSRSTMADRISLLNLLCNRVPTRLLQFVVTSVSGKYTASMQLDDFFLGPFNSEKFVYEANRAGSSRWEERASRYRGNFAITRCSDSATLPLCTTPLASSPDRFPLVSGLVASIYSLIGREMWAHFWEGLRDLQLLEAALRSGYVDVDSFRSSAMASGAEQWTIFSRIGETGKGWVSPSLSGMRMTLPQPEAYKQLRGIVRADLGFSGWSNSEVSVTLKSYCKMLWRARSLKISSSLGSSERLDDAFLHHMIALEMLFNEKSSTTVSVVRRTAAVAHAALGRQFSHLKEEVDTLYEARSQFVHQGVGVTEEQVIAASMITEAIAEW